MTRPKSPAKPKPKAPRKPAAAKAPKEDGYQVVTDRIIAALEAGTVPWTKSWNAAGSLPRSLASGKTYRGVNTLLLGLAAVLDGYTSPWWGTYKQITAEGGQVRRGETHTKVTLWTSFTKDEPQDDGSTKKKTIPLLRTFQVFNLDQADWAEGLPKRCQPTAGIDHDTLAEGEALFDGYFSRPGSPSLVFGGDRACYSKAADRVTCPRRQDFRSIEAFYSTLAHEAGHSTGHPSRLAREGIIEGHRFGDPLYSKEELVAELTAAFICAVLGIDRGEEEAQSAAYLANWIGVLRGDRRLVIQAAGAAQRAADLIQGVDAVRSDEEGQSPTAAGLEETGLVDAAA